MQTTLNVKVDKETKTQAKTIAKDMGLTLSSVVNGLITQFVKTQSLELTSNVLTLEKIKNAEKSGKSPTFDSAKDAISWLEDNS